MLLFFKVFFTEFIAEMGDKNAAHADRAYFEIQAEGHYIGNSCCNPCAEWIGGPCRRTGQRIHSRLAY